MARITDLDELLGEDKKVRLQGKLYVLPPDLPVELYLRIQQLDQRSDVTEREMVETLYDELLGLFRYKQPDLKSLPLSMSHLITATAAIYGDGGAQDEEARPPRRKASGGRRPTGSRART